MVGITRRAARLLLRKISLHCILPGLRMTLLRWSGIGIGKGTFVNAGVVFVDNYRGGVIKLGDRAAVAPGVIMVADSDPNASNLRLIEGLTVRGRIDIEDDAWIGAGAIILPNVRVGKSAIVGAGAVVTKDVECYSIVAGNPAKKLGDVRERGGCPA